MTAPALGASAANNDAADAIRAAQDWFTGWFRSPVLLQRHAKASA